MAQFDFIHTPLAGLTLVQHKMLEDHRGFFSRHYCNDEFRDVGFDKPVTQINHTLTRSKGAVRGMHFQHPPHTESKLVSCLHGEIFDVAIDLRFNSPTFLCWYGVVLSAKNKRSLMIPEGFAHGFQALAEDSELIYLHTAAYCPESEGALNARDPKLGINWPLAISDMSEKDSKHKFIDDDFQGCF